MQNARLIGRRLYRGKVVGKLEGEAENDKGVNMVAHVRARPEHLLLVPQSRLVWAESNTAVAHHPREQSRSPGDVLKIAKQEPSQSITFGKSWPVPTGMVGVAGQRCPQRET